MSEGKRPGGLTALAVINFVFSAGAAISTLGLVVVLFASGAISKLAEKQPDNEAASQLQAMTELGQGFWILMTLASALAAVLLLLSGIGYLTQRKFLGRALGNAYAISGILATLLPAQMMPEAAGGGMNLGTLLNLIYPVLTLILINGTFKEDFIR
jgi:hypothetical protein